MARKIITLEVEFLNRHRALIHHPTKEGEFLIANDEAIIHSKPRGEGDNAYDDEIEVSSTELIDVLRAWEKDGQANG